jgi:hypothetical protein
VRQATSTATWGDARVLPGSLRLNYGSATRIAPNLSAISCSGPRDCSVAGSYTDRAGNAHALVASELHGHWTAAREVPGDAALNQGGIAELATISCASPGNCSAGGDYRTRSNAQEALVVSEVNGAWGRETEVPGTAHLNAGGTASVTTVSCASPGNCTAGGYYSGSARYFSSDAFVVDETHGVWGRAHPVPGVAALNTGGSAILESVSCAAPGGCSAGGDYTGAGGAFESFVVSESKGVWGRAHEVPNAGRLSTTTGIESLSCGSVGNCTAGGYFGGATRAAARGAFVVDETHGVWGRALVVPGSRQLSRFGADNVSAVSCTAGGLCSAGGSYSSTLRTTQVFVAGRAGGTWGAAAVLSNSRRLNAGGSAAINSLSCGSPGNCAAVGFVADRFGADQAVVANEHAGVWGAMALLPAAVRLNTGGFAQLNAVSCTSSGTCAAAGVLQNARGADELFIADFAP